MGDFWNSDFSEQEQQKIQARERAVERLEAAKKQAELAASSEDPEVPEPLGGDLGSHGSLDMSDQVDQVDHGIVMNCVP